MRRLEKIFVHITDVTVIDEEEISVHHHQFNHFNAHLKLNFNITNVAGVLQEAEDAYSRART